MIKEREMAEKVKFSRTKIWLVFGVLFVCGAFVGVGIANWGHAVKEKQATSPVVEQNIEQNESLTSCQAIEGVLLQRLENNDNDCDSVKRDLDVYKKLATYGCDENHEKYVREIDNKSAILDVACDGYVFEAERYGEFSSDARPCEKIEEKLYNEMPGDGIGLNTDGRIERAKIYAIMAERGCPENVQKYTDLARKELEIARGISDDKLNEREALEAVETYKRLKMQADAEEIFNKVKKLTNPAIDFIMQVEKIINE